MIFMKYCWRLMQNYLIGDRKLPPIPTHHHIMYHQQFMQSQDVLSNGAIIPYIPRSSLLPGMIDQEGINDADMGLGEPLELQRSTTALLKTEHANMLSYDTLVLRYPVMWQGLLALRTDQAAVQMHFIFGNPQIASSSLPCNSDQTTLRIVQRLRSKPGQLEGIARKMQTENEYCMLLALPFGRDNMDVLQQSANLQTGFINFLQEKQAVGLVKIHVPDSDQHSYIIHVFPSCEFSNENLARIAPDLLYRIADIAHLLIVIVTGKFGKTGTEKIYKNK